MSDKTFIIIAILAFLMIAGNIVVAIACWNVPLGERTGFCAMQHMGK